MVTMSLSSRGLGASATGVDAATAAGRHRNAPGAELRARLGRRHRQVRDRPQIRRGWQSFIMAASSGGRLPRNKAARPSRLRAMSAKWKAAQRMELGAEKRATGPQAGLRAAKEQTDS